MDCVGACRPVTDTEPFIREVEGQEVVLPLSEPWFKESAPYWCPTVANYETSGAKKKFWGYCGCPKQCADITNPSKCVTSQYTKEATKCDFFAGKCFDEPTCSEANNVYSAGALQGKCEKIDGCVFAKGSCQDLPTSCAGVNDVVSSNSGKFAATCSKVGEGCYVAGGSCQAIPTECSTLNDQIRSVNDKFRQVCAQIPQNCFVVSGSCEAIPSTCDALNGMLNIVNNKFKRTCASIAEGCFVGSGKCSAVPATCAGVNELGLNPGGNNFKEVCSASAEGCLIQDGACVKSS